MKRRVFQVTVQPSAYEELDALVHWIGLQSPDNAELVYDRVIKKLHSLATFPRRCPRLPPFEEGAVERRSLTVSSVRVDYLIDGDNVIVVVIEHAARDRHPD